MKCENDVHKTDIPLFMFRNTLDLQMALSHINEQNHIKKMPKICVPYSPPFHTTLQSEQLHSVHMHLRIWECMCEGEKNRIFSHDSDQVT